MKSVDYLSPLVLAFPPFFSVQCPAIVPQKIRLSGEPAAILRNDPTDKDVGTQGRETRHPTLMHIPASGKYGDYRIEQPEHGAGLCPGVLRERRPYRHRSSVLDEHLLGLST